LRPQPSLIVVEQRTPRLHEFIIRFAWLGDFTSLRLTLTSFFLSVQCTSPLLSRNISLSTSVRPSGRGLAPTAYVTLAQRVPTTGQSQYGVSLGKTPVSLGGRRYSSEDQEQCRPSVRPALSSCRFAESRADEEIVVVLTVKSRLDFFLDRRVGSVSLFYIAALAAVLIRMID